MRLFLFNYNFSSIIHVHTPRQLANRRLAACDLAAVKHVPVTIPLVYGICAGGEADDTRDSLPIAEIDVVALYRDPEFDYEEGEYDEASLGEFSDALVGAYEADAPVA